MPHPIKVPQSRKGAPGAQALLTVPTKEGAIREQGPGKAEHIYLQELTAATVTGLFFSAQHAAKE